jgi:hypothetical protein
MSSRLPRFRFHVDALFCYFFAGLQYDAWDKNAQALLKRTNNEFNLERLALLVCLPFDFDT